MQLQSFIEESFCCIAGYILRLLLLIVMKRLTLDSKLRIVGEISFIVAQMPVFDNALLGLPDDHLR